MTTESQRDPTVRPNKMNQDDYIAPIQEEAGDLDKEPNKEDEVVGGRRQSYLHGCSTNKGKE